jgi:hypothetical protein
MAKKKITSPTVQQRLQDSFREVVSWVGNLQQPAKIVTLNQPPETGSLRQKIKDGLDSMLKESDFERPKNEIKSKIASLNGQPIVLDKALRKKKDLKVKLANNVKLVIRYIPPRPGDRRFPEGLLFRVALPEEPEVLYSVRARRRPYTNFHFVLSNSNPQGLDLNSIRAGLFVLKGLGKNATGFFNATAPSHAKFHFQFFGHTLPLWKNIKRGAVLISQQKSHEIDKKVKIGDMENWLFKAKVLSSSDPESLARVLLHEIDELNRRYPGLFYDLLLSIDDAEIIHVALALRRGAHLCKPKSFYPEQPDVYGDFGGLELCGLIVTIKEESVFYHLKYLQ